MENRVVFLDLDGVIINFVQGVIDWYGLPISHDEVTSWDTLDKVYGKGLTKFWEGLSSRDFWFNLKKYSHADKLIELLESLDAIVCLYSSPAWHVAGWRQDWIQENLPMFFNEGRYLLGPAKYLCAHSKSWLIDDYEHNTDLFKAAGGNVILFPQPWNTRRYVMEDAKVDFMKEQLYFVF